MTDLLDHANRQAVADRCDNAERPDDDRKWLLDLVVDEKSYGSRRILDPLHLRIGPAELVSLVGPSGCGKSTLLRIVAGLDTAFTGHARLNGRPQWGPSSAIGVVFQEPRLLPWLSVADNIAFSAGHRQGKHPRVAELLSEVGLEGAGDLLPKALSGGMAQRVAIARALFAQPRLLLMDEPFSAVDAITRERLQDLLQVLTKRHATATLLVTHDLDEALHLSDRVLLMTSNNTRGAGHIAGEFRIPTPYPRLRPSSSDGASDNDNDNDNDNALYTIDPGIAAIKRQLFKQIRAAVAA